MDLKRIKAKVSRKNVILATKHRHGLRLARHYATKGVSTSVKPKANELGLGTTGGVRRTMVTIKDRIKGARPRNNKVSWLNRRNKKAWALHTRGVLSQASYGIEGKGVFSLDCPSPENNRSGQHGMHKNGQMPDHRCCCIQRDPMGPIHEGANTGVQALGSIMP